MSLSNREQDALMVLANKLVDACNSLQEQLQTQGNNMVALLLRVKVLEERLDHMDQMARRDD